jgi:hypothetical protein
MGRESPSRAAHPVRALIHLDSALILAGYFAHVGDVGGVFGYLGGGGSNGKGTFVQSVLDKS